MHVGLGVLDPDRLCEPEPLAKRSRNEALRRQVQTVVRTDVVGCRGRGGRIHGDAQQVVSLDTRGGKVSVAGWTETSDLEAAEAAADLSQRGAQRFLCTAIEVDGTMEGPAIDQLNAIATATHAQIIASGGVGSLSHLEALAHDAAPNIEGAIVGRALYERKFTVAKAIEALGTERLR